MAEPFEGNFTDLFAHLHAAAYPYDESITSQELLSMICHRAQSICRAVLIEKKDDLTVIMFYSGNTTYEIYREKIDFDKFCDVVSEIFCLSNFENNTHCYAEIESVHARYDIHVTHVHREKHRHISMYFTRLHPNIFFSAYRK